MGTSCILELVKPVWKRGSRSEDSGSLSLVECALRVNSGEKAVRAGRLDPGTEIPGTGGATVGDFWAWAYSEILTNTSRGIFAEFLIGNALRVVEGVRPTGWEDFGLSYNGWKIEVEASAYMQNWHQNTPSIIRFDVGERGSWDSETNSWRPDPVRSADYCVFCLYAETNRSRANVLDTSKWEFYVLPIERIDHELGTQKSVGLSRTKSMTEPVDYGHQLKERVDRVLSGA